MEEKKNTTTLKLAELCEQVAYDRKGENIIRLDMTNFEGAQSDQYIICTAISAPHAGAIAERIQREARNKLEIRPVTCDGTPQSGWMIVDFGSVMVHVMTQEARDKYQLEELWGDAPKLDVIAKLDAEAEKHKLANSTSNE